MVEPLSGPQRVTRLSSSSVNDASINPGSCVSVAQDVKLKWLAASMYWLQVSPC